MASPKKNQKPDAAKADAEDNTLDTQEQENAEGTEAKDAPEGDSSKGTDEAEPEAAEVAAAVGKAVDEVVAESSDIHARLTKAAQRAVGQEAVHALNQLEILTGRLKLVLPAGIAATEDVDLRRPQAAAQHPVTMSSAHKKSPHSLSAAGEGLYVRRNLTPASATALTEWAKSQGFANLVPEHELHVTIVYSQKPVWLRPEGGDVQASAEGRTVEALGDKGMSFCTSWPRN